MPEGSSDMSGLPSSTPRYSDEASPVLRTLHGEIVKSRLLSPSMTWQGQPGILFFKLQRPRLGTCRQ